MARYKVAMREGYGDAAGVVLTLWHRLERGAGQGPFLREHNVAGFLG